MSCLWVVDTNVLVAALLTAQPASPTHSALAASQAASRCALSGFLPATA